MRFEEKKYKYGLELNNEVDCVFAMTHILTRFIQNGFYDKEGQYYLSALRDFLRDVMDFEEFIFWFGEFNSYTSKKELMVIRKKWYDYAETEEMLELQRM